MDCLTGFMERFKLNGSINKFSQSISALSLYNWLARLHCSNVAWTIGADINIGIGISNDIAISVLTFHLKVQFYVYLIL